MDGRKINIVDIESTCWLGHPPKGQVSEIIEIGICQINTKTWEISRPKSIIIKPQQSTLSDFCKSLTHITPAMIRNGVSFDTAVRKLQEEWQTKKYAWGSWGMYDINKIRDECAARKVAYPFSHTHFNIKDLFAIARCQKRGTSLKKAIREIGAEFNGSPHRGCDDAYNAAVILRSILAP